MTLPTPVPPTFAPVHHCGAEELRPAWHPRRRDPSHVSVSPEVETKTLGKRQMENLAGLSHAADVRVSPGRARAPHSFLWKMGLMHKLL